MADNLHNALSKFRNTMLTAVAVLEFELRDAVSVKTDSALETLANTVSVLEKKINNIEMSDILNIRPVVNSGNVVVSKSNSPALAAAIASLHPSGFNLSDEDDDVSEIEAEDDEAEVSVDEDEEEAEVEVDDFEYKGTTYQRDSEGRVYLDGEEVGTWNGKKIIALKTV